MSTMTTGLLTSFSVLSRKMPQSNSHLAGMSDRQLADMGIERSSLTTTGFIARLREAVVNNIRSLTSSVSPEHQAYLCAVRELESYSDAELADLNLVRSNIREAVRHGRLGIDKPAKIAA